MSKEQIRRDTEKLVSEIGAVAPLDRLLKEFAWFQPRPTLRSIPDDPDTKLELTVAAKVRLLKTLLAKVETALLEGRLSAEASQFCPIPLSGEDGVLASWTGLDAENRLLKNLRFRTYQNHILRIDDPAFLRFVGGQEGVRGDLGAAFGGRKASAHSRSKRLTFPQAVDEAIERHLRSGRSQAVLAFLEEYDKLKKGRRTGGRRKQD